jgi:hypothetical protein
LGLIGAVVLVATLGFWFFLGDALQYAFSFVRKDMVTQVSKANGMTPEAFVEQWKGSASGNGQHILNPVKPTAPVVTAGSNGNEAHAEIYNALQALIDRLMKNGAMTKAQADLLSKYVKQILLETECEVASHKAAGDHFDIYAEIYIADLDAEYLVWDAEAAYWEAFWNTDGSYEKAEEAYRNALSGVDHISANLDELHAAMAESFTTYNKSVKRWDENYIIRLELEITVEDSGILKDPEVTDFINKAVGEAYQKGMDEAFPIADE